MLTKMLPAKPAAVRSCVERIIQVDIERSEPHLEVNNKISANNLFLVLLLDVT